MLSSISAHVYEVRPRKDHRGADLISAVLAFQALVVRRAQRIGFRDQKITAPHTDRCEGRLFPPEQSWKSLTVLNQPAPAVGCFVRSSFNGEFCNNRDASVSADDSKSRFPKRVAHALRGRNSLRVAMQIGGGACPCYLFRDCGPRSAQKEQSGETALAISPSQLS
jgi:hypothetical protein